MKEDVSVVVTLYNYKRYLRNLLLSAASQTHKYWEMVIVDDASTDNPMEIIKSFQKKYKIRYIKFEKNQGYAKAKNEGIINSSSEYIVMIDADDVLTPNSISDRLSALKKNPDHLWCHGDVLDFEIDGKTTKRGYVKRLKLRSELAKIMDFKKQYHHRLIHAQSVMIKKDFHRKLGLYDETLRFSADNEMFRRAIRFGYIPFYCPSFVSYYRHHPKQMSGSKEKHRLKDIVKAKIIENVEMRFRDGINESNTRLFPEGM